MYKKTEHSHRTELVSVETKFCSRCKLIADQKSLPTQSKLKSFGDFFVKSNECDYVVAASIKMLSKHCRLKLSLL